MVDPVIAGDGHTYDRTQIEAWMRQQETDGHIPPTSPQTREPLNDTRLVSNMALRRTIERLVNSGRLDAKIVAEWQAAKETMRQSTMTAKRDQSLACAPIGTKVLLNVLLVPRQDANMDSEIINGSSPLSDMTVDLHVAKENCGGGLFGSRVRTADRRLVANLSLREALTTISESDDSTLESATRIRSLVEDATPLPAEPMPESMLLASVFPHPGDSNQSSYSAGSDTCRVLEHVVKRLATIENGLPACVQAEWQILDKELQIRRRRSKLHKLRQLLVETLLRTECMVHAVDDNGAFTLCFPCLSGSSQLLEGNKSNQEGMLTARVPHGFIGSGGVVAGSNSDHPRAGQRGSLFGGAARTGGLFGQSSANTGGGALGDGGEATGNYDSDESASSTPRLAFNSMGTSQGGQLFGGNFNAGANSTGGLFGGNAIPIASNASMNVTAPAPLWSGLDPAHPAAASSFSSNVGLLGEQC